MRADLHTHSNISDGSESIEQLIETAVNNRVDAIAITDHDTLSHRERIPERTDILVLAGVELSAAYAAGMTKAHILGFHIQKPEMITAFTRPLLEARNRNSEKQAHILGKYGYKIDLAQVKRADGGYLYKQHLMDWLFTTGQITERFGNFYEQTFKNQGVCAFDIDYPDVFETVRVVKEAGGLAVLAHPGQQSNFLLIPELVRRGLDGIELSHHSHTAADMALVREYAGKYGLFMTGGSDYHGCFGKHRFEPGDILADESGVRAICR